MQPCELVLIPCHADNYAVLIHASETGETALIDAPDAVPIEKELGARGWSLKQIFVTHHHGDHTAGNMALKDRYGCAIAGPEGEDERIPGLSQAVSPKSSLTFAGQRIEVLETPGHTLGHLTYYWPHLATAFTGDTLFSLGCGRIFEGDAAMMYASLQKIARLPGETKIYCGHEYTLANGRFALTLEPENEALQIRVAEVEKLRAAGMATLPTTIEAEKRTNPFLRTASPHIRARLGLPHTPDWQVFARLRDLKNRS